MNLDKKIAKIVKKNHSEKLVDDINELKPIAEAFDPTKPIMVSIICNTYNHEKYIAKCLDGFLMQKVNFNVEVLIHDDASTDNTQKIIKEYEIKYPNVIKPIYQKENQYSKGVKIVKIYQFPRLKGRYVAFCEGDDYWIDPLKLVIEKNFLEKNSDYIMVTTEVAKIDCRFNKFTGFYSSYNHNCDIKTDEAILWGKKHKAHINSWLRRKECVICDKPKYVFSYTGVGDHPLLVYYTSIGKVKFLNKCMSVYNLYSTDDCWRIRNRNNRNSITNQNNFYNELKLYFNPKFSGILDKLLLKNKIALEIMDKNYQSIFRLKYLLIILNFFGLRFYFVNFVKGIFRL